MVGPHHYKLLDVTEDVDLTRLKAAYHRAAKEAHPDLAPADEKHRAQLRMMEVNEAYMEIVADLMRRGAASTTAEVAADGPQDPSVRRRDASGEPPEGGPGKTEESAGAQRENREFPPRALGTLRDPGYTYYKLGFTFYRRGYTELYSKDPRIIRKQLAELKTYDHYLLTLTISALKDFEQSYRYFAAVIEYAPDSIWVTDARAKLRKLEKFNRIYQRICENLSRNLRMKRAAARVGGPA
jgi:hypothetical protein